MKTINNKKRARVTIALLITVFVLVASGVAYALQQGGTSDSQQTGNKSTNSLIRADSPEDVSSDANKKTEATNTDTPVPTTKDKTSGKKIVQMTVSVDVVGATIYIRGGINNSVEQDGTCFAKLTGPSGESVQEETTLLPNATTTDCKTIQLNRSDLAPGTWKVTLGYESDSTEGQSNESTFQLN